MKTPTLAIGAGDSDLVYELFPQIQYQVNENIAARIGYRRVGYKFKGDEDEDNELNATLAGLIVGVEAIISPSSVYILT